MKILQLYHYPIKSIQGIRLHQATYDRHGLTDDREFILVDQQDRMITLRSDPRLYEFSLTAVEAGFQVSHGDNSVLLNKEEFSGSHAALSVWKRKVTGVAGPSLVNEFFSEVLSREVKCFWFEPQYTDEAGFRDSKPLLLVNLASIRALEETTGSRLDPLRFRPNVIVDNGEPFSELEWSGLQFGDQAFSVAKPCARCIVVNIDPASGLPGPNVLGALVPYSSIPNKVLFGQYLRPTERTGKLAPGLDVRVQD